jgi:hypothetical protein
MQAPGSASSPWPNSWQRGWGEPGCRPKYPARRPKDFRPRCHPPVREGSLMLLHPILLLLLLLLLLGLYPAGRGTPGGCPVPRTSPRRVSARPSRSRQCPLEGLVDAWKLPLNVPPSSHGNVSFVPDLSQDRMSRPHRGALPHAGIAPGGRKAGCFSSGTARAESSPRQVPGQATPNAAAGGGTSPPTSLQQGARPREQAINVFPDTRGLIRLLSISRRRPQPSAADSV